MFKNIISVIKNILLALIILFILLSLNALVFKKGDNVVYLFIISILYGLCRLIEED